MRAVIDPGSSDPLANGRLVLNERVETIVMIWKDTTPFLSFRVLTEIARLGGALSSFVRLHIRRALES